MPVHGRTLAYLAVFVANALGALQPGQARAAPLDVVATVPDLGGLVRTIGGDQVSVSIITKGPQDPHVVEPRPSFIRRLHDADLFVQTGMDLEIGWAPVLLQGARNPKILPGGRGHLDTSSVVTPLEVPAAGSDRSRGDLHPYGNPHYLTDPVHGLRVAALLRDALGRLRPDELAGFEERYARFVRQTLERLVGPELVASYGPDELVDLLDSGRLDAELSARGQLDLLGGWLAEMRPYAGTRAVEDHQFWAYFAHRFGIELVATLEPFAGVAPSTRQLARVVEMIRAEKIPLILSTTYFDPRHADWVAERTGARVVLLAHQAGARSGADGYLGAIDYNVRQVVTALGAAPR
jgi:zinc/manganese transport system substrate-binding protein